MSTAVMHQALAALTEALEVAGVDLAGVNIRCGSKEFPLCFSESVECCGKPMDAEDRVKAAIAALQNELGLAP